MAGTSSPGPSSAPSTEALARWANRHSPVERAALVDTYTPLVRRLAARVYARRVGGELEFADLLQFGMVGLMEAIDRFNPARGVRFEAYASHRIEGAILNGLQGYSEMHQLLAFRRELAAQRLASLRGDPASRERSALARLAELAIGISLGHLLQAPDADTDDEDQPAVPDNAYARVELKQMQRQLGELVGRLPEAERQVVLRHYFQQQPFEQIALGLGLSKGRVSQIHRAALERLQAQLRALRAF